MLTNKTIKNQKKDHNGLNPFYQLFLPRLFWEIRKWTFINVQNRFSQKSLGKK
jgi:hypothetical protein